MKTNRITTLILSSVTLLAWRLAAQTVPSLINYQGRLTDQSGAPLASANYGIEFRLWDSPSNTTGLVWGQRQNVSVQASGVFNVTLGAPGGSLITNPPPLFPDLAMAFTSSNRFLGLTVVSSNGSTVGVASEILPRQQLLSVPFALMAQSVVSQSISSNQVAPGGIDLTNLAQQVAEALNPPGTIVAFGGSSVPNGWILCDGRTVSRSAYFRLFSAIGTAWGNGDGSTTFHVPDLRGSFPRGVDNSPVTGESGRDAERNGRGPTQSGGATGNSVGSFQNNQTGAHTHGGDTTSANGTLTALAFVSGNGNTWIRHRTIPAWLENDQGCDGSPLVVGTTPGNTRGAIVVGQTSNNNTPSTESRPVNVYVNYMIKY